MGTAWLSFETLVLKLLFDLADNVLELLGAVSAKCASRSAALVLL